ncbi:MAG: DUF948 domain-containing protein [Chlamydiales bacterium]
MNLEISIAIMAGAFVVLVAFLILGILSSRKTMKELNRTLHAAKKDLDELTHESLKLVKNLNDLTNDAKRKMHALDFFFKPLSHVNEESGEQENGVASDLVEGLTASFVAFNKIKRVISEYGKQK